MSGWSRFIACPYVSAQRRRRASETARSCDRCVPALAATRRAVDEGEQLRDGAEQLVRDLTVDLDGRVQRARERRVGDDGNVVLPGDLLDPGGDEVLALG